MKGLALSATALVAAAIVAGTAGAQDGGSVIAKIPVYSWIIWGKNQTNSRVSDAGVEGKKAVRVVVPEASSQPGEATAQSAIKGAIPQGGKLRMTVWLKASGTAAGEPGRAILKLKQAKPPYGNLAEQKIDVGPEWKAYSLEHVAAQAIPGGSTNVTVQMSIAPQTIDVGPASVTIAN